MSGRLFVMAYCFFQALLLEILIAVLSRVFLSYLKSVWSEFSAAKHHRHRSPYFIYAQHFGIPFANKRNMYMQVIFETIKRTNKRHRSGQPHHFFCTSHFCLNISANECKLKAKCTINITVIRFICKRT